MHESKDKSRRVLGVICCDRKCSCGLDRPFLARARPASFGFAQHVDAAASLAGLGDCAALRTLAAMHPTRDHAVCDPEKVSTLLSMVNLPRARETVAWAVAERARVNIRGCVVDFCPVARRCRSHGSCGTLLMRGWTRYTPLNDIGVHTMPGHQQTS